MGGPGGAGKPRLWQEPLALVRPGNPALRPPAEPPIPPPRHEPVGPIPHRPRNQAEQTGHPPPAAQTSENLEGRVGLVVEPVLVKIEQRPVERIRRAGDSILTRSLALERGKTKGPAAVRAEHKIHEPVAQPADAVEEENGVGHRAGAGSRNRWAGPKRRPSPEPAYAALTLMCRTFSLLSGLLGKVTRRTPSLRSASALSGTTSAGSVTIRWNEPARISFTW